MNNSIQMRDIPHASRVPILIDLSDDLSITSRNSYDKIMKPFHIIITTVKKCEIFEFFQKHRNY